MITYTNSSTGNRAVLWMKRGQILIIIYVAFETIHLLPKLRINFPCWAAPFAFCQSFVIMLFNKLKFLVIFIIVKYHETLSLFCIFSFNFVFIYRKTVEVLFFNIHSRTIQCKHLYFYFDYARIINLALS